jgi:hypothetical protein
MKNKNILKINIGSGKDVRKGWDNLDAHNKYGANLIFNLNKIFISLCRYFCSL